MYQAEPHEGLASGRVLACVVADAELVEMVEHTDGTLAIRVDGHEIPQLRWQAGQVDSCCQAYMRFVRQRGQAGTSGGGR
jgi:hypothetical protein